MNAFAKNKALSSALCALLGVNMIAVQAARADGITCREYYSAYVSEATSPAPVVPIVVVTHRPHFHGHYAEYHGHSSYGGGYDRHDDRRDDRRDDHGRDDKKKSSDSSDDEAILIAGAVIAGGLITTSIAEDMKLKDAQSMISIIDQAEMGDGPQLRDFATQVQAKTKASVTVSQVAAAVTRANEAQSFCQAGDLDSVDELAQKVAGDLSASR